MGLSKDKSGWYGRAVRDGNITQRWAVVIVGNCSLAANALRIKII
jgi:hypothetical protein